MNTKTEYDQLTAEQIEAMQSAAIRLGAVPTFHAKSKTWQVNGHRLDLWFERRHWPDPKVLVVRRVQDWAAYSHAVERAEREIDESRFAAIH